MAAVELAPALDEIAERVYEMFPVDLVSIHVVDEVDPDEITYGYCLGPSPAAQALAPLLTPDGLDPIGLGDAARESGEPGGVAAAGSEPAEITRLAELADAGGTAGVLHRADARRRRAWRCR